MSVVIRLTRIGTNNVPFFRIVVTDSRKKQGGMILENIGTYDAKATTLVRFSPDRYDAWVKLGAQPSDTAKKIYRLYKKNGVQVLDATIPVDAASSASKKTKTAKVKVQPTEVSTEKSEAETKA